MNRDPAYNDPPYKDDRRQREFGARRWVTVAFFALFTLYAVLIWVCNASSETNVARLDGLLIVTLVLYRIAKPLFHNPEDTTEPQGSKSESV